MQEKPDDVLQWITGATGIHGSLWVEQRKLFLNIIQRFYSLSNDPSAHYGDAAWVVVQSCRHHLASRLTGFEQKPFCEPIYPEGNRRPRSPRHRRSGDILPVEGLLWVSRDDELTRDGRLARIHINRTLLTELNHFYARESWWCLEEDVSDIKTLKECRIPAGMSLRKGDINYAHIFTLVRLCGNEGNIDRVAFEIAPESGGILSHREAHLRLQMSLTMDVKEHDFLLEAAGVPNIVTF